MDDSENYRNLRAIIDKRKIPVREIHASDHQMDIGGARLEFLWPEADSSNQYPDLNQRSLVFRLVYEKGAVLFTGDIGMEVEKRLFAHKGQQSNVLKVPHHGSRYSSSPEFLHWASPEIALISAGYGNSFHLPAEQTLARLKEKHVEVYRTDLNGTIRLIYDEGKGKFIARRQNWHFN